MIENLVTFAETLTQTYGVWGIFFLAFFQEIFPPLPSTVVTFFGGFFALGGAALSLESLWKLLTTVSIPLAAGLTIGAMIIYGLVYWLGKPLVERAGKFVGVSWSDIEKLKEYVHRHASDEVGLFIARSIPGVPSIAINVFFGLLRWRPWVFALLTFLGTIVRAFISGFIGWQLGSLYHRYATVLEGVHNILLGIIVIAVVVYLLYRRKKKQEKSVKIEEIM